MPVSGSKNESEPLLSTPAFYAGDADLVCALIRRWVCPAVMRGWQCFTPNTPSFLDMVEQNHRPEHDPIENYSRFVTGNLASRLTGQLAMDPGENGFMRWYMISNSFPIIAASLGPISNLNSIVALVDPWRDKGHSEHPDFHWVVALNSLSLFFGCCANISLFLNFAQRIRYNLSQTISIGGWYVASVLLLILLICTRYMYFGPGSVYTPSQGYWHALITCILYFINATLLLINEIGHLAGQYEASFNLTENQRSFMMQTVALMVWIGIGGGVFSRVLELSFGDSCYYCVVTITTVGLGDNVPKHSLGRALCLPYAFIGVILLGLIVTTIRSLVLEAGGQALKFHRIEKARARKYGKRIARSMRPEQDGFETMRKVHNKVETHSKVASAIVSISSFLTFLLLGSMVFYFLEDEWTYFEAVYFSSLCLLTIGYGDFAPKSAGGRPFFIVWALGAIPLMTILVSSLGDTLFKQLLKGGNILGNFLLSKKPDKNNGVADERALPPNSGNSETTESDYSRLLSLCSGIRSKLEDFAQVPDKTYTFDEWKEMIQLTKKTDIPAIPAMYWLSDRSPIRLPIVEPRLFLDRYINALERELTNISEREEV